MKKIDFATQKSIWRNKVKNYKLWVKLEKRRNHILGRVTPLLSILGGEFNMGSKVAWVGLGLSPLGLGFFLPEVIIAGAVVLVVGVIMIVLDK